MTVRALLTVAVTALSLQCGGPDPGEACEATGDGFTRRDPCSETCVEWAVPCADGSEVTPSVCSAGECDSDSDCPSGFACGQVGSVTFECLPADTCDAGFAS
jgi:hypothetical protein